MKYAVLLTLSALSFAALGQTLPPAPGADPLKLVVPKSSASKPASRTQSPGLDEKLFKRRTEMALPGVGKIPGDKDLTRANVLRVQSDRNELAYVSGVMPNRIATPFEAPRLIDNTDVTFEVVGQSIYLVPKDPERTVAVYITGSNANDPVLSLTLVPQAIPQQTIILQLDAPLAGGSSPDAEPAPAGDAYSERIRYVLRQVALNKVPEGFVEGALPASSAALKGLTISPIARYSGRSFDIYRYVVTSTSFENLELSEEAFYSPGVRAVAFFPTAALQRGDRTTVFVIADKSATEN